LMGEALVPLFTKDAKGKDRLGRDLTMPRFPGENNGGKAFFPGLLHLLESDG
jgi:hypothetical protein